MSTTPALPEDWQPLVEAARNVRGRAYAPYSGYAVGAAVRTSDGQIFVGCNVENASYGLTICAERVAMSSAVAAGQQHPEVMCISLGGTPVPCGSCRQFLFQFNPGLVLLLDNAESSDPPQTVTLDQLLPRAFRLER